MRGITQENIEGQFKAGLREADNNELRRPWFLLHRRRKPRFPGNYHRFNQSMIADSYLLSILNDFIESPGNSRVFTRLDVHCGYWKFPIACSDENRACFTTHRDTYRYLQMPFGRQNGPKTFQCGLYSILCGVCCKSCLVYLGDFIVFSKYAAQYIRDVRKNLKVLRAMCVPIQLNKCELFGWNFNYLGHTVLRGNLVGAVQLTENIMHTPFSTDRTKLNTFRVAFKV